jgi:hypothetical protein
MAIRDDKGKIVLQVPSEAVCIAALIRHYGWVNLGEDTLRRYRKYVSAAAAGEAHGLTA